MRKAYGKHEMRPTPGGSRFRLTREQKILLPIAVILTVAVVVVAAYQNLFVRPELPGTVTDTEQDDGTGTSAEIDYGEGVRPRADGARKSEDYYTVLILGRDTGGGGNTDTILLASYDVTNQKASVMSIPRDTMVNVNWDVKKINSVYNMNGGGDKGLQAIYKEISQLVGFEPDYQVIVEWEAVGALVEAIGGVYFDVPYRMDYHDPFQDLVIEQEKGYRLLTGEDAMQVIRWRKNDDGFQVGDDGRMKIQQDFIKAVIQQMMTPKNILNIGKIAQVFEQNVDTDLSFQNILWFGKKAFSGGLSLENISFFTMPWKGVSAYSRSYSQEFGRNHYLSYVVPISQELLKIVNDRLSPFAEAFTLNDLDIMYVNSDGSLGSTSGYVEDRPAAVAPVLIQPPETDTPDEEPGEGEVIIDPETGEVISPPADPEGEGQTPNLPGDGEIQLPPEEQTPPESGGEAEPEDPTVPIEPELPPELPPETDPTAEEPDPYEGL